MTCINCIYVHNIYIVLHTVSKSAKTHICLLYMWHLLKSKQKHFVNLKQKQAPAVYNLPATKVVEFWVVGLPEYGRRRGERHIQQQKEVQWRYEQDSESEGHLAKSGATEANCQNLWPQCAPSHLREASRSCPRCCSLSSKNLWSDRREVCLSRPANLETFGWQDKYQSALDSPCPHSHWDHLSACRPQNLWGVHPTRASRFLRLLLHPSQSARENATHCNHQDGAISHSNHSRNKPRNRHSTHLPPSLRYLHTCHTKHHLSSKRHHFQWHPSPASQNRARKYSTLGHLNPCSLHWTPLQTKWLPSQKLAVEKPTEGALTFWKLKRQGGMMGWATTSVIKSWWKVNEEMADLLDYQNLFNNL